MAIPMPVRYVVSAVSRTTDRVRIVKKYSLLRHFEKAAHPAVLPQRFRSRDVTVYFGGCEVPVRVFQPDGGNRRPHTLLLFFHGGGWVTGDVASYSEVCARMARMTGCTVASADYRLAPEHRYPAALDDCCAVTEAALRCPEFFGEGLSEVALAGDSAGGNLAACSSLRLRDRGGPVPKRMILFYPLLSSRHDPATSPFESVRTNGQDNFLTNSRINDYLDLYKSSDADLFSPYLAPMECADLSRQPDALILTADLDPLRDEGEAYGERLRLAGSRVTVQRVPDCYHGFLSLPGFPAPARVSYQAVNRFLESAEPLSSTALPVKGRLFGV